MRHVPTGLQAIRGLMGCCFLLHDADGAVMIDTGLFGEMPFIRRQLRRVGLTSQSLQPILLTHGHLDHAGNFARLKDLTGARVFGHPAEQAHVNGTYPYHGINRWCGRLEALGRAVFRHHPAASDEPLAGGQRLPFWGGLRVIHLPGHTVGHCGFFSERHQLLFSGDMFASYWCCVHKLPAILNSCPELFAASAEKIRALNPRWIIPSHCDFLDGELHRRRFARLYGIRNWPVGG